jgi:hypothetical protein
MEDVAAYNHDVNKEMEEMKSKGGKSFGTES